MSLKWEWRRSWKAQSPKPYTVMSKFSLILVPASENKGLGLGMQLMVGIWYSRHMTFKWMRIIIWNSTSIRKMGIYILSSLREISKSASTVLPTDEATVNFVYLNFVYYSIALSHLYSHSYFFWYWNISDLWYISDRHLILTELMGNFRPF